MSQAVPSTTPRPGRRLFTTTEAAEYLRVSRSTIYRELASGRLPYIQIRTCRLIPEVGLERWIDEQVTR